MRDAEKKKAYDRAYSKANPKPYKKLSKEENRKKHLKRHASDPSAAIFQDAKSRAKKKGLEFNIEKSDIVIPERCPIFGMLLVSGVGTGKRNYSSPSIDRIDNTKGYIKGNVWVISWRANHIKAESTLEELEIVVAALKKLRKQE